MDTKGHQDSTFSAPEGFLSPYPRPSSDPRVEGCPSCGSKELRSFQLTLQLVQCLSCGYYFNRTTRKRESRYTPVFNVALLAGILLFLIVYAAYDSWKSSKQTLAPTRNSRFGQE